MTDLDNGKILLEIYGEIKKTSSDVKHMSSTFDKYQETHEKEHKKMWLKTDNNHIAIADNTKWRNRIIGVGSGISAVFGGLLMWLKIHKGS